LEAAVTKALSDAQAASQSQSRIIAAESLRGVSSFSLTELGAGAGPAAAHQLGRRDLTNDAARAAYTLGRKRGFEQGAREGLEQGYSEGSQALEEFNSRKAADVAQGMQALADAFRSQMAALESQVASDLVSLAIDLARQVLRRELATDPAAVLPAAREALRAVGEGASQLELRMNPDDAAILRQHLDAMPGAGTWQLREDAGITRGGCRVEADTGVADASFEARWQAVMATLGRDGEPMP